MVALTSRPAKILRLVRLWQPLHTVIHYNDGMSTKRFTAFRIDEELLRALDELKARDGMSQAEAVRRALRDFLRTKGIRIDEQAVRPRVSTRKRSRSD
jgi:hypothetical protein